MISQAGSLRLKESPRPGRVPLIAAGLFLILLIHTAGRIGAYCSPLQNDSYIYTSFGYRIAQGDVLYRDMSDIKPPGLFQLYSLMYHFLPPGRASIAPMESLFLFLAYLAIYKLAATNFGRSAGWVGVICFVVSIGYFGVNGHVIEGFGLAENLMVFPAAACAMVYVNGCSQNRLLWLLVAGIFAGLDSTIKQSAAPLILAVAIHWTVHELVMRSNVKGWLVGMSTMVCGGVIAWSPFVAVMALQGTLSTAWSLLTSDATAMLTRGHGWPQSLDDILPLWLPCALILWSGASLGESFIRRCSDNGTKSNAPKLPDCNRRKSATVFFSIWCALELLLVHHLPLRSAHYYVSSCLPIVLLGGAAIGRFDRMVGEFPKSRRACWISMAAVVAVSNLAPANQIIATAIARYRSYDWAADRAYFDEAIGWGNIHFGRGPAWVEPAR